MKSVAIFAGICALALGCSKSESPGVRKGIMPGTFVVAEGVNRTGHVAQLSLRRLSPKGEAANGMFKVQVGAVVTNKSTYLLTAVELELQIKDATGKVSFRKSLLYNEFKDDFFGAGPYLLPNMSSQVLQDVEIPTDVLANMRSYWYEITKVESFERAEGLDDPLKLFAAVFASPPKARIAISGNPKYLKARDESSGLTLTHIAFLAGDQALIDLLVSQKADLKVKSKLGIMPIHCAVLTNGNYGLRLLRQKGISLESKDVHGRTPLMIACRYGNAVHAKMALDEGAKITARDKAGVTPFWYVCYNYRWDHTQFALEMAKVGFDPNEWTTPTLHPLHIAYDPKLIEYLCSLGANVNGFEKGTKHWTPLHAAAKAGTVEQVMALLRLGGDPTIKTVPVGNTPADIARKYGHPEHERILRSAMMTKKTRRR